MWLSSVLNKKLIRFISHLIVFLRNFFFNQKSAESFSNRLLLKDVRNPRIEHFFLHDQRVFESIVDGQLAKKLTRFSVSP